MESNDKSKALKVAQLVHDSSSNLRGMLDYMIYIYDYGLSIHIKPGEVVGVKEIAAIGKEFGDDNPLVSTDNDSLIIALTNKTHQELYIEHENPIEIHVTRKLRITEK